MNAFSLPGSVDGQRKALSSTLLPLLLVLLASPVLPTLHADPPENSILTSLGLLLEPKFTQPSIWHPIPDAQDTVLVPARQTPSGPLTLSAQDWEAAGLDWPEVLFAARTRATLLEQSIPIQWHKDHRQIVLYASLESPDPFLPSIIYSPSFPARFHEFLGRDLLVVIPDRSSVFVFPRFGPSLDTFGPGLVRRYEDSLFKVSLEVFLLHDEKPPRAIGKIAH